MEDSREAIFSGIKTEAVKEEDLLGGYWGGPPRDYNREGTTIFEFKEDGTATAYYFENETRHSYETTWHIERQKLVIDNVDGEKTYYKFKRDSALNYYDTITSCSLCSFTNSFRDFIHYSDYELNAE